MSDFSRPLTAEEKQRSRALDLAHSEIKALAALTYETVCADAARPLRQKDRHLYKTRVAQAVANIQRWVEEVAK